MSACTRCSLCNMGTLAASSEVGPVSCNVRRHKADVFTYWRCSGCGSLHCAEDADLNYYYKDYPIKQQKLNFHARIGYRNRLRLLQRAGLRRTHRILDFGCGPGLFVQFLQSQGFQNAFGYDPFEDKFSDRHVIEEKTYDVIVSYDVIEHDDNPRRFVHDMLRLLRPGGLLVIGTPNADGASVARTTDPSLHAPYHRHILSEKALLKLGLEQGLEVPDVYRRSFFDSLLPTVNSRFMWRLVEKSGGLLDSAYEPPNLGLILCSPELIFLAFFGYFVPANDNMLVSFRKPKHCCVAPAPRDEIEIAQPVY